jgi:hypothetical protein
MIRCPQYCLCFMVAIGRAHSQYLDARDARWKIWIEHHGPFANQQRITAGPVPWALASVSKTKSRSTSIIGLDFDLPVKKSLTILLSPDEGHGGHC